MHDLESTTKQASEQVIKPGIFPAGGAAHDLVPAAVGPMPTDGRLR